MNTNIDDSTYKTSICSELSTRIKEHFFFTVIEIVFPEKKENNYIHVVINI